MTKLTAKQENFAQGVAGGLSQADAYRAAYNAENMKPESVQVKASELMANGKVAVRVSNLKQELSKKQLWTREMSTKGLIKAYKVGEEQKQSSSMTAAIKELNAMHGFNAPSKVDLMNTDGSMTRHTVTFVESKNADQPSG